MIITQGHLSASFFATLIVLLYFKMHINNHDGAVMEHDKAYWSKVVTKVLKAELAKRDISYPTLVSKLNELDIHINVEDLRGRMSRGTFSAILFVQCLRAIGVTKLSLEEEYF